MTRYKNPGRKKRVGLAVGGGAVRGIAHVGVISVLEEAGIEIDFVAGCSSGAILASLLAAGWETESIKEFAYRLNWWLMARPVWPSRGFLSLAMLEKLLNRELNGKSFNDLKLPCTIIATDIETGMPVRLNEGSVAEAVHASCCIPGLVTPKNLNGRLLVDGAICDMVPVSVLNDMGADYVIGVDIFSFNLRRYLGPFGYLIASFEILLERAGGGIEQADCLVTPRVKGKTWLRFSKKEELYNLGRSAAIEKIDDICNDLRF